MSRYMGFVLSLTLSLILLSPALQAGTKLPASFNLPILKDVQTGTEGVFLGVFRPGAVTEIVESYPIDSRKEAAAAMWFSTFGGAFPESSVRYLANNHMAAQITWEWTGGTGQVITLADLASGKHDAYLREYAHAAAVSGLPFMLRPGHEFNGEWYPWSVAKNGQDGEMYKKAWRHVVDVFRDEGAYNVQWVWCFNNESVPNTGWNDPWLAYPGDDYVDWVGIDGYNFGPALPNNPWKTFAQVFSNAYASAQTHAPNKPIIIGEFGSTESDGDKAAWLKDAFASLPTAFPAIKALTYFDIVKETAWAITSSDKAQDAYIKAIRAPYVRGNGEALLKVVPPRVAKPK